MADQAAEATPETVESKPTEEAKPQEAKEDKTPETPVTEPMTNGSSTPETPKAKTPAAEALPTEPEQLPLNGLSIQDTKEVPEVAETVVESKHVALAAETPAPAPADIPDKTEDLPILDKIADLIPEIPDLPSDTVVLTETASDVAVAN